MEMKEPKRYHHGDLKRVLLTVADKMLAHQGLHDLSLRAVAKTAGVSHTAPYKHFKGKNELVAALILNEFKKWQTLTEDVLWRLPDQQNNQLQAIAEGVLQTASTSPHKFRLMLSDWTKHKKTLILNTVECGLSELQADFFWSALIGKGLEITQDTTDAPTSSRLQALELFSQFIDEILNNDSSN